MSAPALRARAVCLVETAAVYAMSLAAVYGVLALACKVGLDQWAHNVWGLWRRHPHLALPDLLAGAVGMVVLPIAWEKLVRRAGWRELGFALPAHPVGDWLLAVGLLGCFAAYGFALSREIGPLWRFTTGFQWMAAVAWLVVACGEECLYRGFIQRRLGRVFGRHIGVVLAAAVFAFAGHPWAPWVYNLAYRLPFGLLAGALYVRSRSLLVPIGAHWAFNVLFAT